MGDPKSDSQIELPVETSGELEAALDVLIRSAHETGVDVNDIGIDLRNGNPTLPDWEVHIVRLK